MIWKTIKIHVMDVWPDFNLEIMAFYHILRAHYNVIVTDSWEDADYIFFSCFGDGHWSVTQDKIKIFFTAENITPDFNTCDYAIGFDWLSFGDRYLRLSNFYSVACPKIGYNPKEFKRGSEIGERPYFCSFTVSNCHASEYRVKIFEKLSQYKKVDSGGKYKNNIGAPIDNKFSFDSLRKFTICCENSSHSGYTTEKLYQAFASGAVPIYWGDPDVSKVFNKRAFINALDYKSIDEVVDRIIAIDNDAELYLELIAQPIFVNPSEETFEFQHVQLQRFLVRIFEQDIKSAYRYNRHNAHFNYSKRMQEIMASSRLSLKNIAIREVKRRIRRLF